MEDDQIPADQPIDLQIADGRTRGHSTVHSSDFQSADALGALALYLVNLDQPSQGWRLTAIKVELHRPITQVDGADTSFDSYIGRRNLVLQGRQPIGQRSPS